MARRSTVRNMHRAVEVEVREKGEKGVLVGEDGIMLPATHASERMLDSGRDRDEGACVASPHCLARHLSEVGRS